MRLGLQMASEGGGGSGQSFPEYLGHHLKNLTNKTQVGPFDLSVIHYDTVFFSLLSAAIVLFFLRRAAKRATPGVPGKFQTAVEMLVEFVYGEAKSMINGKLDYIAPLALTVFCWVAVMNAIDLFPVDWFPWIAEHVFGLHYLRPLPTADMNATLGMSLGVLLLSIYYIFKIKGTGGFVHDMAAGHFALPKLSFNPLVWLGIIGLLAANLLLGLEGLLAPTLSHGIRIYGNMYAGELVFFLINGLNGTGNILLGALGLAVGVGWAVFHILIVLLQAYVFMMLTLVYVGRAYQHH
jgi:F-type H+-transporting ATPase subunit a